MEQQNSLNVAVIQMVSEPLWQANLETASRLITDAARKGAQLVVLPEFFIRIANNQDPEFMDLIEPIGNGKIQNRLKDLARENGVYLVAGSIPTCSPHAGKCYNTCIVYNPDGEQICYYNKIHLFKFNNGEHNFDEEKKFASGGDIVTFRAHGFTFGLTICYDLRFPEMFRKMAGVDGIILPAAFTHHTGIAHWEVLLRARAIENQCYVLASAQGGIHAGGRHTFGHSMIIDPWGRVNSFLENGEGIVYGKLDKAVISKIRRELPALEHRKF